MRMIHALCLLPLLFAAPAFSMEGDIPVPDAFFLAKFDRLICENFEETGIAAPSVLAAREVVIERLIADRMLIQFSIGANFKQDDSNCRYSVLFTRGKRDALVRTESKAFAIEGASDCQAGKLELDTLLTGRLPFNYTKNPIRFVALKVTTPTAAEVCGEGATSFRTVFERVRAPAQ